MTLHILNCGEMRPWFAGWHSGCTALAVERDQGLVLVDCGPGEHDFIRPAASVRLMKRVFGMRDDVEQTAARQIVRLGYRPEDVGHIVMTHLHFDHAGGLADFPRARVHLHRRELEASQRRRSPIDLAYDRADFAHGPDWALYDRPDADWLGLEAIRLPFSPEMYLLPLFGHTRGHCGVALRFSQGWVLQAGDALPIGARFDLTPAWLNRLVLGPHGPRIQRWAQQHPEVRLLTGHLWADGYDPAP